MAYHYGSRLSFFTSPFRLKTSFVFFVFLLLSNLGWGQCFKPAINISAKNTNVVVGDFNGDGKPDFAATQPHYNQTNYTSSDSIAIFLNQGGGLFDRGTPFFVGGADSLAVGDINADGKLDIAVTNGNESVSVLLGDGKGRLAAPTTLTISGDGYPALRVAITDLNGDKYPDLAVTGLYDSVTVLLNDGHASFGKGIKYSAGKSTQISQTKTGDFNGDGKPDLILVQDYYHDYFVSLLLNNGAGGFAPPMILRDNIFKNAHALEVGDFNGDTKTDVVIVGDSIAVMLNTATGGFATNRLANPNKKPYYYSNFYVAANDVNGDGKADLVLPGYVLLGKSNGLFDSPVSFNFIADNPYGGFLTADFDSNGRPDLLAARTNYYTGEIGIVSIFLNCTLPINAGPQSTPDNSQTATVGVPFAYTVNAFTDAETPNSLTYSASLSPANGLSFDATTRLISGTPSLSGVTSVTITAIDPTGLSAATSFTITTKPPVILGVDEPETGQLTLSPNPATDIVQITLTNANRGIVALRVVSAGGQLVRTHTAIKTGDTWQHTLSVLGLPAGSYYLNLYQNGQQTGGRVLKL